MVAASMDDEHSDTHWMRSSVDSWLHEQAVDSGVQGKQQTTIEFAEFDSASEQWFVTLTGSDGQLEKYCARWLIDASGGSESLRPWMGARRDDAWMRTRTSSIFAHFRCVQPFASNLDSYTSDVSLFDGDDAAQHHVFEHGWFWTLRFDDGVTSVGVVLNESPTTLEWHRRGADSLWGDICNRLPSVAAMMRSSQMVDPQTGLRSAIRLSRCNDRAVGPGWVSLPTAYGFVDPLHSTGIAHALSGVERVAEALLGPLAKCKDSLGQYARDLRGEVEWLDTLVSLSYRGLPRFDLFTALACYYFMAAIGFERDCAANQLDWPRGYMLAKDPSLRAAAENAYRMSGRTNASPRELLDWIRNSISDWNDVGLLDPARCNRIAHSATKG
jgi:FADH2 O2-dependent halogenase